MPSPNSPGEMIHVIINKLPNETGRSFEQWVSLARDEGPADFMKCISWLKTSHNLKHYPAQYIATEVFMPGTLFEYDRPDELLENLYSGPKEHLRKVYKRVRQTALGLDEDIQEVVCKTYTSYRHKAQFAIAAPKTNKFLDLELAMPPGTKATGRLEAITKNNPKITHRIRIATAEEVDKEVIEALQAASDYVRSR